MCRVGDLHLLPFFQSLHHLSQGAEKMLIAQANLAVLVGTAKIPALRSNLVPQMLIVQSMTPCLEGPWLVSAEKDSKAKEMSDVTK